MSDTTWNDVLISAAAIGSVSEIETALSNGADINAADPDLQETALLLAVQNGDMKAVEFLIAHEADVNQANEVGVTPLMASVIYDRPHFLAKLIMADADMNAEDKNGARAIFFATHLDNQDCLDILCKSGAHLEDISIGQADKYALELIDIDDYMKQRQAAEKQKQRNLRRYIKRGP